MSKEEKKPKKEKKEKKLKKEKKVKKEKKEKKRKHVEDDNDVVNEEVDEQQQEIETKENEDIQEEKQEEKQENKEDDNNNNNNDDEDEDEEGASKRKRKRKRKKKNPANEKDEEGGQDGEMKTEEKINSIVYTVFVEGIPFDCTEDEVKGFFVDNGCDDVLQMRLPRWQDTGRLRGFGHVVFNTIESKTKALSELNGKNLKKRYLTIQEAKQPSNNGGAGSSGPRPQPPNCRTVFVKNLPYSNITEEDIVSVFQSCGKIVDDGVRLSRNYSTKQLKGFGYVEFKNPEGAYSAVQRASKVEGIKVGGRKCYVDYEESQMKGSFRAADGQNWQKKHGNAYGNDNKKW
mmetsp:Transcript_9486/g.11996  ORF Transcript_9486/g.11996 Transcript_9486/m.11996 type:complete len:345 (-) Transcript_9486:16-1050(-)